MIIDLDAAADAGVLMPEAALVFRSFSPPDSRSNLVDGALFCLLTGFNDIFVAVAGIVPLLAAARLGALPRVTLGTKPSSAGPF